MIVLLEYSLTASGQFSPNVSSMNIFCDIYWFASVERALSPFIATDETTSTLRGDRTANKGTSLEALESPNRGENWPYCNFL